MRGTWGSSDDAKVGPTPWAHQGGKQDTESRQEMGHTESRYSRTPGEWVTSGSNSPQGITPDKVASEFRGPAGGRTTPGGFIRTEEDKNTDVGARRQKTWAPRRRTKSGSWSVGVSAHYLHLLLKVDSDSTWICMEEKPPRLLHTL